MRGGRGGVVSPCGQPSRESTPPYAAINAASPAAECAHDASVSHRSLIQVFAIPAAYARRGGPHRHPTWTTRTRPTTTNGCSPPNQAATRLGIPVSTLARWRSERRDDILTTIRLGYSNARIEAFNNKIKVTIRMAYGFRNTDNLIAMIKLRCSGPPIHLPTPIL